MNIIPVNCKDAFVTTENRLTSPDDVFLPKLALHAKGKEKYCHKFEEMCIDNIPDKKHW